MAARVKIEYITNLNKKKFIMHENSFDWIDENNNKWSKYNYTKIQAIEKSKTLRNCYNCIDSENCIECKKCNNCKNCYHCYICYKCKFCYNCKKCNNCIDCNKCINCNNCEDCEKCKDGINIGENNERH